MNYAETVPAALEIDSQPHPDVWRAWGYDGRVVYFRVGGARRDCVDAAVALIGETVAAWPINKPLRVVYDVRRTYLNPHTRRGALEVYELTPYGLKQSRTAIVLPDSWIGVMLRGFATHFLAIHNPGMERRFFVKASRALAWAADDLPPPQGS